MSEIRAISRRVTIVILTAFVGAVVAIIVASALGFDEWRVLATIVGAQMAVMGLALVVGHRALRGVK